MIERTKPHVEIDQLRWLDRFSGEEEAREVASACRRKYDLLFEGRRRSRWTPTFLWGSLPGTEAEDPGTLSWIPKTPRGDVILAELDSRVSTFVMGGSGPIQRMQILSRGRVPERIPMTGDAHDGCEQPTALEPMIQTARSPGELFVSRGGSGQLLPSYMITRQCKTARLHSPRFGESPKRTRACNPLFTPRQFTAFLERQAAQASRSGLRCICGPLTFASSI